MARINHLWDFQRFSLWRPDFPVSVGIYDTIQIDGLINILLEYIIASIAVRDRDFSFWINHTYFSNQYLLSSCWLTLMAHKHLDVTLSRLRKSPNRLPTGWMSLGKWWLQLCKEINCGSAFDHRLAWKDKEKLTESRIVRQLLCCSNHRHSRRAVCHICRIVNRIRCTWVPVIVLSIRPTVRNTRKCSIPGCRCRRYQNIVSPGRLYSTNAAMSVQFPMKYYASPCPFSQWNLSLAVYLRKLFRWCRHASSPMYADYGVSNQLCALNSDREHLQSYPWHPATDGSDDDDGYVIHREQEAE